MGYPGPPATPIPKSHSEEPDEIMAYTGSWEQKPIKNRIYPNGHPKTQALTNLSEIQAMLNRPRPSLDNSDDDYPEFQKKSEEAKSKSSAMTLVISTLLGNLDIPHEQGILFSNLAYLTDDFQSLPKPDFYDGSHLSTIECGLLKEVKKFIMPSKNPSAAILPTFLVAVAAPSVTVIKLGWAAWHYGVLAAFVYFEQIIRLGSCQWPGSLIIMPRMQAPATHL